MPARLAEAESRVGPPRVVLRSQVELGLEEPARRLEGVHAQRPLARLVERFDRPAGKIGRFLAEGPAQLERALVVIGELLGKLVAAE